MGIGTDLKGQVETWRAAGVNIEADPRDVTLPGIWITPDLIQVNTLDQGSKRVQYELTFIAGDSNTVTALDELDALLDSWMAANPTAPLDDLRPVTVTMPSQAADPLPALQTTITLTHVFERNHS